MTYYIDHVEGIMDCRGTPLYFHYTGELSESVGYFNKSKSGMKYWIHTKRLDNFDLEGIPSDFT